MDSELKLALSMLESALASGDEDVIKQQVLEVRATGIFAPEMYQHLNELSSPSKQLRAMIDAIKLEEDPQEQFSSEEFEAFEAISKMSLDEQLNALEAAVNYKDEEEEKVKRDALFAQKKKKEYDAGDARNYPKQYPLPVRLIIISLVALLILYIFKNIT
jgi:hypothetical protein